MRDHADFLRVKTTGQAKAGRFVILSTLHDPALNSLRIGLITTKRCGKAHDRNLLRRRFRGLIQAHAGKFTDQQRFLVTIARPGAADASYAELEADWLRQAKRLQLIRPTDTPRP